MASHFSIEAVFRAVDRMTRPLQKMGLNSKRFTKALKRDFAKAQRSVAAFGASIKRFAGRAIRIGLVGGLAAAGAAIFGFVKQASKIENAVAAFQPLLGSVDKAKQLVQRLNEEAATTPFQFEGIAKISQQLLPVMNSSIEDTIDTFRMLGDTAGGNMQKLESITRGFSKALLKGKPDLESLNIIAEAGVPIFTEMAKSMGISKEQIFELSKQGKLTNKDLTNAFRRMTSSGGIFFKGMEIASLTLSGRFSTLKDRIALTAAELGTVLLPFIKELVDKAIEAADKIKVWITANKDLIKTKVEQTIDKITIAFQGVKKIIEILIKFKPAIFGLTIAFVAYKVAMIAAAIATAAFGVTLTATGIGGLIVLVGLLITGIIFLIKNWDKVSAAMQKVWDFMKKIANWIKDVFLGLINKIVEGFQAIGKFTGLDKESREARREAREEGGTQRRGRGVVTTRQSISETTNRSEIRVTNDGRTDVETDSGSIRPGGSIILQPSG